MYFCDGHVIEPYVDAAYLRLGSRGRRKYNGGGALTKWHSQPNKPSLQTMLQKYPLLAFSPVNIIDQYIYLYLFAIGYGVKVIEERADEFGCLLLLWLKT